MRPEYIEITKANTKRTWVRLDIDMSASLTTGTPKRRSQPDLRQTVWIRAYFFAFGRRMAGQRQAATWIESFQLRGHG